MFAGAAVPAPAQARRRAPPQTFRGWARGGRAGAPRAAAPRGRIAVYKPFRDAFSVVNSARPLRPLYPARCSRYAVRCLSFARVHARTGRTPGVCEALVGFVAPVGLKESVQACGEAQPAWLRADERRAPPATQRCARVRQYFRQVGVTRADDLPWPPARPGRSRGCMGAGGRQRGAALCMVPLWWVLAARRFPVMGQCASGGAARYSPRSCVTGLGPGGCKGQAARARAQARAAAARRVTPAASRRALRRRPRTRACCAIFAGAGSRSGLG